MRVGAMDGAPHVSAARVKAARKALGPDIEITVDAHGTYTVAERQALRPYGRGLRPRLVRGTGDRRRQARHGRGARRRPAFPIATGESEATRFDFRDLAVLHCADIFQPDPAFCGGITEAMRIGALAARFNLRFAPHLWAGAPCFFAGLHLCAASPASFIIEYSSAPIR